MYLANDSRGARRVLFLFTNLRHMSLKILFFDGTGLWLMTKRLDRGTFFWPKVVEPGKFKLKL
jgi:transposase